LGLTSSQTKVYLTLLVQGTSTAKSISMHADLPREEIYQILPKLHSLGLVEKLIERPYRFKPTPINEAVNDFLLKRKNRTKELEKRAKQVLENHSITSCTKKIIEKPRFVFVPSKQALIRRLEKAIKKTRSDIQVLTSYKRLTFACHHLKDVLLNAWDRGVKGKAIINIPEENHLELIKICWKPESATLRFIPSPPKTVMAMYDKKQVFIFTNPNADLKESPALWSNYPSILNLAEDYFKIAWTTALANPSYHIDNYTPLERIQTKP